VRKLAASAVSTCCDAASTGLRPGDDLIPRPGRHGELWRLFSISVRT
jgi:hypothetical protein